MVGRITPPRYWSQPWPWPFGKGNPTSKYHHQTTVVVTSQLLEVLASHVHSSIKKVALTRCLFCAQILEGKLSHLFPESPWELDGSGHFHQSFPWKFLQANCCSFGRGSFGSFFFGGPDIPVLRFGVYIGPQHGGKIGVWGRMFVSNFFVIFCGKVSSSPKFPPTKVRFLFEKLGPYQLYK